METLTRRINSTFGTLTSLKGRHGHHHHHVRSGSSNSADDILNSPPCLLTPDSTAIHKMDFGAATPSSSVISGAATNPSGSKPVSGHMRSASGTSTQSGTAVVGASASAASLSVSMNSVSSEGSSEDHLVEQEDIVALTHDVRAFKEALSRLRRILHPNKDKLDNLRVAAHERLGEVLRILRAILEKYPPLQSTELLMAAGHLIQQVKDCTYEDDKCNPAEFFESIDQLALAFSSRVSEYLMGDIDTTSLHPTTRTRSCENLIPDSKSENFEVSSSKDTNGEPGTLTAEEIDEVLMKLDCGVNLALHRAKVWSKYAKDVMNYVEKRASLEAEHSRSLEKLAQNVKTVFKEESFLPFQSIYGTALDQDVENANFCQATCTLLKEHKFVEPLSARRSEHEKHRKQIKETWQRECKRTQEAIGNLRKARSQYIQRNLDYEKAKESVLKVENSETNEVSKLDKKKRLEEDALLKVADAESLYKACVDVANERHHALENTKATVLKQVRELMLQCDQTLKAVTVCYFQLQHTITAQAPVQTLCESSRLYEPGSQYLEFVKKLPIAVSTIDSNSDPFSFEAYSSYNRMPDRDRKSVISCETLDESGTLPHKLTAERRGIIHSEKLRSHHVVMSAKVWGPAAVTAVLGSDSDSIGSSQSNKSRDTSPTASPQGPVRRVASHGSSGDELDIDGDLMVDNGYGASYRRTCLSKAAATHTFRKLKTLAKCRECDTYVYFQGLECCQCGLASHKKCLESLAIQCGHKRLPRRMTTFGVDISSHLQEAQINVPHLVLKCVSEIDRRGCQIKGIYRVSGVKSRVEKLCQSFENGANLVDLSDVHPNVIANVLKLYLRQLPEPLLTFHLYPEFIRIAKEAQCKSSEMGNRDRSVLNDLKEVVRRLPASHRSTLASLMHHLHRVSKCSSDNNMPPSNLGIVFGPTLLRSSEGASLTSLVDTVHQAKTVELLITNADAVFGDDVSLLPIYMNGRSQSIGSDISDRRKQSSSEETDSLLQVKVQSSQSVTKSCIVNAQSPDDDTRKNNCFNETSKIVSCESSSAKIVSNVAQSRNSIARISSSELQSGLPNTSDDILKQPCNASDAASTIASTRNSERAKSFSSTSGVATQTDLSFLRNLMCSSPAPSSRKQADGNNNNNNSNNLISMSTDVSPNHDKVCLSGTKEPASADKIVIHVAGPREQNEVDDQTSNGEVQAVPAEGASKSKSKASLKQCREAETSAPTSLEFLLEVDHDCRGNDGSAKKSDGSDLACGDGIDNNSQRLALSHNQLDQDSGFEDAKTSPNSSPSHYVSPYLSNYPYWPYRWTTGAPLATYATMKVPAKVTTADVSPSDSSTVSTTFSTPQQDTNEKDAENKSVSSQDPTADSTSVATTISSDSIMVSLADHGSKNGVDSAVCDDMVYSDREPHFV